MTLGYCSYDSGKELANNGQRKGAKAFTSAYSHAIVTVTSGMPVARIRVQCSASTTTSNFDTEFRQGLVGNL